MQKENRIKQLVEEKTRQAFSEKGFQPLDLTNVAVSKLDIHVKDSCTHVTFPALICESPDNPEQKFMIPLSPEKASAVATALIASGNKSKRRLNNGLR